MERQGKNITYASRHMSTMWNPFSYKNTEPKYPDGLAQYSIGQKYTNHFVVEGEETLIILYPGFVGSVAAFQGSPGNTPTVTGIALHADNGDIYTRNVFNIGDIDTIQETPMRTLSPTPKFSAWRPVSYAIKIQPISNHAAIECGKDGWWEAIRITNGINDVEWGVHGFKQEAVVYDGDADPIIRGFGETYSSPEDRAQNGFAAEVPRSRKNPPWINGKGFIHPGTEVLTAFDTSDNWTLQPSYSRGCIKDLQCWTFQLNNIRRDNSFIDLRGVSTLTENFNEGSGQPPVYNNTDVDFKLHWETWYGNDVAQYSGVLTSVVRGAYNHPEPDSGIDQNNRRVGMRKFTHTTRIEGFDSLHSKALDTIAIKLHGRTGSRFLVQCAANIEYLAGADSTLQEYTTTSYAALDELSHYLDIRGNDYKFPNHNYFKDKIKF